MLPEPCEISWPCAASIDKCCTGGFIRKIFRLYPKRGTAPVDVYVHINHAWCYNTVGAVNYLCSTKGRYVEPEYFVFSDN